MDTWPDAVSGEEAKNWNAVSLVTGYDVNQGELTSANANTGEVAWKDKTGEVKTANLGQHAIRIVRKR